MTGKPFDLSKMRAHGQVLETVGSRVVMASPSLLVPQDESSLRLLNLGQVFHPQMRNESPDLWSAEYDWIANACEIHPKIMNG